MSGVQQYDRSVMVPLICERLSKGEPLAVICRELNIARRTVYQWRDADPAIAEQMQDARDEGYDAIASECMRISDTPVEGEEAKFDALGTLIERKVVDMLGHRKLQIETRLKLLAKWDPKRYGDKTAIEHSGPDGGPVRTVSMTTEEFEATAKKVLSEV